MDRHRRTDTLHSVASSLARVGDVRLVRYVLGPTMGWLDICNADLLRVWLLRVLSPVAT
jgi:hypothetical protein